MSYYGRGDFYTGRGDYYGRGDFFGKLKKVAGKAVGLAGKVAPVATMVNPALGMGLSSFASTGKSLGFGSGPSVSFGPLKGPLETAQDIGRATAGLTPLGQVFGGAMPGGGTLALRTPSRSVLSGYAMDASGAIVKVRKRRRMNVLNPRALRRGMRRVQGFAKFARKTISFTQRVKMRKRRPR